MTFAESWWLLAVVLMSFVFAVAIILMIVFSIIRSRCRDRASEYDVTAMVASLMDGDVARIPDLLRATPTELSSASIERDATFILRKNVVGRVLRGLVNGEWPVEHVQSWASFVRRGYIANAPSALNGPIAIEYEALWEDEIVEVVSRLDQLGDAVDGHISKAEALNLLQLLGAAT